MHGSPHRPHRMVVVSAGRRAAAGNTSVSIRGGPPSRQAGDCSASRRVFSRARSTVALESSCSEIRRITCAPEPTARVVIERITRATRVSISEAPRRVRCGDGLRNTNASEGVEASRSTGVGRGLVSRCCVPGTGKRDQGGRASHAIRPSSVAGPIGPPVPW